MSLAGEARANLRGPLGGTDDSLEWRLRPERCGAGVVTCFLPEARPFSLPVTEPEGPTCHGRPFRSRPLPNTISGHFSLRCMLLPCSTTRRATRLVLNISCLLLVSHLLLIFFYLISFSTSSFKPRLAALSRALVAPRPGVTGEGFRRSPGWLCRRPEAWVRGHSQS